MSKNKYTYYPIISFNGAISKRAKTESECHGFPTFNRALTELQEMLKSSSGNGIDFAGVIKSKDGTVPFDRIKGFDK